MSGGKGGNGVPHRVLDQMAKFEAAWSAKQAELIKRHNDLASQIVALEGVIKHVAGFTASEMGKFQGEIVNHIGTLGRTTQGLDMNVLALAEILKEIVGQLTQVDFIFKKLAESGVNVSLELTDEEVIQVKSDAETWYKDLMSSAFKKTRDMIQAQEEAAMKKEAEDRAAAEAVAVAAQAEQAEKSAVGQELKDAAAAEHSVVAANTSGGPGTPFPEGADIFGG